MSDQTGSTVMIDMARNTAGLFVGLGLSLFVDAMMEKQQPSTKKIKERTLRSLGMIIFSGLGQYLYYRCQKKLK